MNTAKRIEWREEKNTDGDVISYGAGIGYRRYPGKYDEADNYVAHIIQNCYLTGTPSGNFVPKVDGFRAIVLTPAQLDAIHDGVVLKTGPENTKYVATVAAGKRWVRAQLNKAAASATAEVAA